MNYLPKSIMTKPIVRKMSALWNSPKIVQKTVDEVIQQLDSIQISPEFERLRIKGDDGEWYSAPLTRFARILTYGMYPFRGHILPNVVYSHMLVLYLVHKNTRSVAQYCSGRFRFDPYHFELEFSGQFRINPELDVERFDVFVDDFLKRMTISCKVKVIAFEYPMIDIDWEKQEIETDGHANALFVYRKNEREVVISWYEPHGSHSMDASERTQFRALLTNIQQVAATKGVTISILDPTQINCRSGVQFNDAEGFCVTYSNFWFFLTLLIFKEVVHNEKGNVEDFQDLIAGVEPALLVHQEKLPQILIKYIVLLLGAFFQYNRATSQSDLVCSIESQMRHHIREFEKDDNGQDWTNLLPLAARSVHLFDSEISANVQSNPIETVEYVDPHLHANWQMVYSQPIRYVNIKTHEQSIIAPPEYLRDKLNSHPRLRGDWTEYVSEQGTLYYFNSTTGENTYDAPPEFSSYAVEPPEIRVSAKGTNIARIRKPDGDFIYHNLANGQRTSRTPLIFQ